MHFHALGHPRRKRTRGNGRMNISHRQSSATRSKRVDWTRDARDESRDFEGLAGAWLGFRKRDARSTRESLALPFLRPLSNFQRVSRAIGAAIGRDMCVTAKDADTNRMRHARSASGACVARRYVLCTGSNIIYNAHRRCSLMRGVCNLLEINTTSLFLITEMVTRSALLVANDM